MTMLRMDLDELAVETFEPAPELPPVEIGRPRTFEPGCTRDFCRHD